MPSPSVRFQVLAACLILLQGVDFLLTWLLIDGGCRSDVYEANPLANAILIRQGWFGLASFKSVCAVIALGAALLTSRRSLVLGERLLAIQCLILGGVVGYSGVLLAEPNRHQEHIANLEASADQLDGKIADLHRLEQVRAAICRRVLEGKDDLATGIEQMRNCLATFSPNLMDAQRIRLPNLDQPSQLAAYLYHHCSRLLHRFPQAQEHLYRLGEEIGRRYPSAPRYDERVPPIDGMPMWTYETAQAS